MVIAYNTAGKYEDVKKTKQDKCTRCKETCYSSSCLYSGHSQQRQPSLIAAATMHEFTSSSRSRSPL